MKYFLIIFLLFFSITLNGQSYNDSPDSIPVQEKILRDVFYLKRGEKVKINFNQYLRFDGEVIYNEIIKDNNKTYKRIIIKNNDNILILNNFSDYFTGDISSKNKVIFSLRFDFKNKYCYYWFEKLASTERS